MGKYAFLCLRALPSSETLNPDFLHTKAVFLFKEFDGTVSLKAGINQNDTLGALR